MKNGEKPIVNPFVILREEFDDWAILFDPDTGHGLGLNPTGVYIWKLFDGVHTIDDLLEDIRHHTDNVPEDAGDHIRAFVDALVAEGLAALDSNRWGPHENAYRAARDSGKMLLPSPEASAREPFTYVPPQLVNLNSERAAGTTPCNSGSQATGTCNVGNLACDCSTGNGGGFACCEGNCVNRDWSCCCGACAQNTNMCDHGNYPANCYCSAGSSAPCECAYGDYR